MPALCPSFALLPETVVAKQRAVAPVDGVVFTPFCGRGTTVFETLIRDRAAAGCAVPPVAAGVAGATSGPPPPAGGSERGAALEEESRPFPAGTDGGDLGEYFRLCLDPATYDPVCFLRHTLAWRAERPARFIAALSLGAVHGASSRSPPSFRNRLPRTTRPKPAEAVR